MNPEQFSAITKQAGLSKDKEGWEVLPEGRFLTFYVAGQGSASALSVSKVERLRVDGEIVHARTQRKELFWFLRSNVFAVSVDGVSGDGPRRAGFG